MKANELKTKLKKRLDNDLMFKYYYLYKINPIYKDTVLERCAVNEITTKIKKRGYAYNDPFVGLKWRNRI